VRIKVRNVLIMVVGVFLMRAIDVTQAVVVAHTNTFLHVQTVTENLMMSYQEFVQQNPQPSLYVMYIHSSIDANKRQILMDYRDVDYLMSL